MSPTAAKQIMLRRRRQKGPRSPESSGEKKACSRPVKPEQASSTEETEAAAPPQPAGCPQTPQVVLSDPTGNPMMHMLMPEPSATSAQSLFQNSFAQTFEGKLRQRLRDSAHPLSEAIGEVRALQVLSSVIGFLGHFPMRLRERDGLNRAKPSVEVAQATLLRMAWNFVRNGDEDSPHELRAMMRLPCPRQEQQEIHTLQIAIIEWGNSK